MFDFENGKSRTKHEQAVRDYQIRGIEARRKALYHEMTAIDDILEKFDPHRFEKFKMACERKEMP